MSLPLDVGNLSEPCYILCCVIVLCHLLFSRFISCITYLNLIRVLFRYAILSQRNGIRASSCFRMMLRIVSVHSVMSFWLLVVGCYCLELLRILYFLIFRNDYEGFKHKV